MGPANTKREVLLLATLCHHLPGTDSRPSSPDTLRDSAANVLQSETSNVKFSPLKLTLALAEPRSVSLISAGV